MELIDKILNVDSMWQDYPSYIFFFRSQTIISDLMVLIDQCDVDILSIEISLVQV